MNDALADRHEIDEICKELGIAPKRRLKLTREMGDDLLPFLRRLQEWARGQDQPRLLHRHATASTPDYVDVPAKAMQGEEGGEPEAVSQDELELITARARRDAKERDVADWKRERETLLGSIRRLRVGRAPTDPVRTELRVIERRLQSIDRKLRREAA